MAGVGIAHPTAAAVVLWPLALWRLRQDVDLARFLAPIVALPFLGLFIGRLYWGYVSAPVALVLAVEGATLLVSHVRAAVDRRSDLDGRVAAAPVA
jgi:hypothetical protein